jgi:hypothetical protein
MKAIEEEMFLCFKYYRENLLAREIQRLQRDVYRFFDFFLNFLLFPTQTSTYENVYMFAKTCLESFNNFFPFSHIKSTTYEKKKWVNVCGSVLRNLKDLIVLLLYLSITRRWWWFSCTSPPSPASTCGHNINALQFFLLCLYVLFCPSPFMKMILAVKVNYKTGTADLKWWEV